MTRHITPPIRPRHLRPRHLRAWALGFRDGRQAPHDLSSGITWDDDQDMNESYDAGANAGQVVGRMVERVR